MSRIKVNCPTCRLGMTGSDPKRFEKPIRCPRCNNVFQGALASPLSSRSPLRLLALVGLVLLLAGGVAAYCGYPLLATRDGRRGSGAATTEADHDGGRHYALLIGVNDYQALPALRFAENDAAELANVLGAAGYEVTLLTGKEGKSDRGSAPTQGNIKAHLERIARKCRKADTLVLAFAGHGVQIDDQAYFCPADADEKEPATLLSLHRVYAELGESKAGARLVLVDACRNDPRRGGTRRGITAPTTRPSSGVAALFSCSPGEFANETDRLGRGHGVFFHFVIEGLRGKALNEDGEVTWDRLNEYVKKQVARNVGKLVGGGAKQTPHAMADLQGESPVLLRDPTRRPRLEEPPAKDIERDRPLDRDGAKEPPVKDTERDKPPDRDSVKGPPDKAQPGDSYTNSIGMKLVLIPRGKFLMGSPTRDRPDSERQHEVEITKDFYLGVYEVTQKQFRDPWRTYLTTRRYISPRS